MSRFAVLALCLQACLIQTVFSQCGCGQSINPYAVNGVINNGLNLNNAALGFPGSLNIGNAAINSVSAASCGSYGGQGTGQVSVAGDVSASGNTVVVGSVPVLGAVDFSGVIPATGSVSISGQCGCGCQ